MSFLRDNARYKLVLFDKDKNILDKPYYSFPEDDNRRKGIESLVRRIIRGKEADNHKYAYIYNNISGKIIEIYIDGVIQKSKNSKDFKKIYYGKEISLLKMWYVTIDKPKLPITRYSDVRIDAESEKNTYWELVNSNLKSKENRNIIKYAEIYRIEDNLLIGRYLREDGKLKGIGIYHRS